MSEVAQAVKSIIVLNIIIIALHDKLSRVPKNLQAIYKMNLAMHSYAISI